MRRPRRRSLVGVVLLGAVSILLPACGSSGSADEPPTESSTTTTGAVDVVADPEVPGPSGEVVLFRFTDPASVTGWTTVDDSVMGGVSASTVTWESGSMVFSGVVTTDNNGGFVSALGPTDPTIGERARGSDSIGVGARLDRGPAGRYLLWLRTTDSRRWVAEFTPLSERGCCLVIIPWTRFVPVDRFLRPITPATALDPAQIVQLGFYLLPDVRRVDFRLTMNEIVTGPLGRPSS